VKLAAHEHTEEQQRAIELAKMEQMRKELSLAPPSAFGLPTPVVKEPEYGSDLGNFSRLVLTFRYDCTPLNLTGRFFSRILEIMSFVA
jgi:hypothetical protein